MDNKNFFRALFWAVLVFLLWNAIAVRIWPPEKPSPAPSDAPSATTSAGTPAPAQPDAAPMSVEATPADADAGTGALHARGVERSEVVVLGTTNGWEESPYRMRMVLSNIGASVETVVLSDHRQSAGRAGCYQMLAPIERDLSIWRSLAIEKVNVDKAEQVTLDELKWGVRRVEVDAAESVAFTATVVREESPILELTRTFTLPAQPAQRLRHDVDLNLKITNLTDEQHDVIVTMRGAVGLASEGRFTPDRKVFCAVKREGLVDYESKDFADISKRKTTRLFPVDTLSSDTPFWLGEGNLYFTCTACPVDESGAPSARRIQDQRGGP